MVQDAAKVRILKKVAAAGKARLRVDAFTPRQQQQIAQFVKAGLIECEADQLCRLTREGRAHLKRKLATAGEEYRSQHLDVVMKNGPDKQKLLVNQAESPLSRLYSYRKKGGERLVDDAEFLAGERLRADFERAGMTARTGLSLTPRVDCGSRKDGAIHTLDSAMEARDRVNAALRAVGEELGSILLDVCCFLKGLEWVERERQWPVRSAKIVLKIGLKELARHYGLSNHVGHRR